MRRALEQAGFALTLLPGADVYETKDEFIVELDVPGYEEKDIRKVSVVCGMTVKRLPDEVFPAGQPNRNSSS